ncbi:MAG: SPOR domain-containing protein [Pseudomonadota bacterium]
MAEQTVNDEHAEIKKRAMRRLIVAGTLVTAAIVTLTVLNHKPEEQKTPVTTTSEAPAVAIPEPTPTPPEEAPEDIAAEVPAPEVPTAPDSEAAPATPPPPPPPQVVNRTSQAAVVATPKAASTGIAAPAPSSVPQAVTISPVPVSKKTTEPASVESKPPVTPAAAPARSTEPSSPKGYVVQLGLFSNYENAVQLQKRLADHGIKSYTETRLHVGPFQNKAEADQAMTRIRNMGINAVLVPTR